MNWGSIGKFIGGKDKAESQKPQVFTIPLTWLFGGLSVVFFLCDMKWGGWIFAWLAALCIIGFAFIYAIEKRDEWQNKQGKF